MQNLTVIIEGLVPVYETSTGEKVVYGTELHSILEVKSKFADWVKNRLNDCEAVENEDFQTFSKNLEKGRPAVDYIIKLDIAKEMAMLERNEKGKQVRRYFIDLEKAWNTPEQVFARALKLADKEIEKLKSNNTVLLEDVKRMKPKEVFADAVTTSTTSILIGELAKILKQNGYETGEKRLFSWLRENGYLIKRKGTDYNAPTQKSMELGLFEVKETAITHADGHVTVNKTTKVTGKGQQYFLNKFLVEVA